MLSYFRKLFGITLLVLYTAYGAWTVEPLTPTSKCFVVLKSQSVAKNLTSGEQSQSPQTLRAKLFSPQAQTYQTRLRAEQDEVAAQIQAIDPTAKIVRRHTQLVNTLTVHADPNKISEFAKLPEVAYVAPIYDYEPRLNESVPLMNLPEAWEPFNGGENAGEGVLIAVVDTGIDATHPMFEGKPGEMPDGFPRGQLDFTTNKIIVARAFPPDQGQQGDSTPLDRDGHGSNVSSIAAGDFNTPSPLGMLSGVAPGAFLGNYKVFTSLGATSGDQLLTGIEQATMDRADVINLSLGINRYVDPQHDPIVQALRNAIHLGIAVVVAAGNEGRELTTGAPAHVEEAMAVGSLTNAHTQSGSPLEDILVSAHSSGTSIIERVAANFGAQGGPYRVPIIGEFPIVDADSLDGGGFGGPMDGLMCSSVDVDEPINGWLLVQRGDCTFTEKVNNAQQMGAVGVLLFNSADGDPNSVPLVENTSIPAMLIDRESGLAVKQALQNTESVTVQFEGGRINDAPLAPNRLSAFSSAGPGTHYLVKPDFVTIGQGNYAATQNDLWGAGSFNPSGFEWFSGTSMAAPRVSGMAALFKQKFPNWPVSWIKSALGLTAQLPVMRSSNATREATILQRGAGRLDIARALQVDAVALPHILSWGKRIIHDTDTIELPLTIVNPSEEETYTYELLVDSIPANLSLSLSQHQFTLEPRQRVMVFATLDIAAGISNGDFEPRLRLQNQSTGNSYLIPSWLRVQKVNAPRGNILVIDDDSGERFESFYQTTLGDQGRAFTPWDVESIGNYPTLNYLNNFDTVIWVMGETSLNLLNPQSIDFMLGVNRRQLFEDELMKYLMEGGQLFLSGQDYIDQREISAFAQDLLGIQLQSRDIGITSVVAAEEGNPISGGLGRLSFNTPSGFTLIPDYIQALPNDNAIPIFFTDTDRVRSTGVMVDGCTYRVVYCAFPLELLPQNEARLILQNGLQWLQEQPAEPPRLDRVEPQAIRLAETAGEIQITIKGQGFGLDQGYRATINDSPVFNLTRESCDTLTGTLPADIQPADYTLNVVTGDGHYLHLENALQIQDDTRVSGWPVH